MPTSPSLSNLKQQRLKNYQPIPTQNSTLFIFIGIGSVLLFVGVGCLMTSLNTKEKSVRYDDVCEIGRQCEVEIDLEDMEEPVLLYYELTGFYQNYRLYIKSRSFDQLKGEDLSKDELVECKPAVTAREMDVYMTLDNSKLDSGDVANPCGLVAKSYFNDTFSLARLNETYDISEEGIAWESDLDLLYERTNDYQSKQWTDVENG
mmetsp:Transcript_12255/g.23261  ORF Transcript_12255/g.23261 Transcript_12255/m.23261 type:complete len:205 (-) Transcript_12255:490-1104(-)